MDYPITMDCRTIDVWARQFHTPNPVTRELFHAVLTAGHGRLGSDYNLASWSRPGHDLVLGVEGRGRIQMGGKSFDVRPGELAWADANRASIRWPGRSGPWTIYWMRVDSGQMNRIADALNVLSKPVFGLTDLAAASALFERVIQVMATRRLTMDANLNAAVAELVAMAYDARSQSGPRLAGGHAIEVGGSLGINGVLAAMRADIRRRWTISDLVALTGVSQAQLFRLFRDKTGTSPMDYLRRERITVAKRQLTGTPASVSEVADSVGYSDPYYFSRDFTRVVGSSPRKFRRNERADETPAD